MQAELADIQKSFKDEAEFAKVVEQSKFCTEEEIANDTPPEQCEDVINQARLLALQRELSAAFAAEPTVTDDEIEDFYDANIESFKTPATRDARVILNEDEKQIEAAQAELEGLAPDDPDFDKAWKSAARKYSQDAASKDRGGLLEGLVEGQGDPQLDQQVFNAEVGQLVGPFETDRGIYLVQVTKETPETVQPLDEASAAIEQQLVSARQQAQQTDVQNDFIEKWKARTQCIDEVMMQFCDGFVPPEAETVPGQPPAAEPAPVNPNSPIEPGTATLSIDGTTVTGAPQGPQLPVDRGSGSRRRPARGRDSGRPRRRARHPLTGPSVP